MTRAEFAALLQEKATLYDRTLSPVVIEGYRRYLLEDGHLTVSQFRASLDKAIKISPEFFPSAPKILSCAKDPRRPAGSPPVKIPETLRLEGRNGELPLGYGAGIDEYSERVNAGHPFKASELLDAACRSVAQTGAPNEPAAATEVPAEGFDVPEWLDDSQAPP